MSKIAEILNDIDIELLSRSFELPTYLQTCVEGSLFYITISKRNSADYVTLNIDGPSFSIKNITKFTHGVRDSRTVTFTAEELTLFPLAEIADLILTIIVANDQIIEKRNAYRMASRATKIQIDNINKIGNYLY
jgi:hypothetical protein